MSKKIIVLALPGIGTKEIGFSKKMEMDIIQHSMGTILQNNVSVIELRPFNVEGMDTHQEELFDRIDNEVLLSGPKILRRFVMSAFGDALTFERDASAINSPYRRTHLYLRAELKKVNALMDQFPGSRLVIVAASLGVQILSTYIWDADKSIGIFHENPADRTDNLRNLDYLASIGCNIPLFISGLETVEIAAIDKRNIHFTWDNFYDKDDVLGWPLEPVSPSYRALVTDYQINSGLFLGSHVRYWDDNDFTKPLTWKLIELYNSL